MVCVDDYIGFSSTSGCRLKRDWALYVMILPTSLLVGR